MREALDRFAGSGVTKETESISGQIAVRRVLNNAVDVHWDRCKARLRNINREQTLVLVSRLIKSLHRDRVSSERSGRARLRHYAESPEYADMARITMGRRDRAFLAYRVVAEMALCECPSPGGRVPGLTDIDALSAEVATLIAMAHDSDAVERGLIEPELQFRADGAIEPANGGASAFMASYIFDLLGESIALDVDAYPILFEREPKDVENLLRDDDPFLSAFQAEFGLELRQCFELTNALQGIAVDRKQDVALIRRSELQTALIKVSGLDDHALRMFLNAFGLVARRGWDAMPDAPCNFSDIWPWLFERRLSLMLRPMLIVPDKADDPLIIFGVRQIDMGVRYAATLFETGSWPREKLFSEAGRTYTDKEGNRRGRSFEAKVAALLRDGGWFALNQFL